MAVKAVVAATLLKILPTKRKVCSHRSCDPVVFHPPPTGQILHVVRVCLTDVPVIDTSPVVVQILVQLLSNWTIICCLHHCHLSHDQGGWGWTVCTKMYMARYSVILDNDGCEEWHKYLYIHMYMHTVELQRLSIAEYSCVCV